MDDKVELLVGAGGSIPSKWSQWNAESTYTPLRSVTHLGSSYVCKKACRGVDPEADVALGDGVEGEYWIKTASKGDKGDKGDRGIKGNSTEVTATEIEEGIKLDIKNTVYKEDGSAEEDTYSVKVKDGKKGDKGDPFTYEDLTDEQIKELQLGLGEAATNKDIIPEQSVAFKYNILFVNGAEDGLIEGDTYIINWKGVKYEAICYDSGTNDENYIGNYQLINPSAEGSNYPFCILAEQNSKLYGITKETSTAETVKIRVQHKGALLAASGGGVSIPAGAKVGQIIQVSKIDKNKKPIEWVAVDLPTELLGGSLTSPDGSEWLLTVTNDGSLIPVKQWKDNITLEDGVLTVYSLQNGAAQIDDVLDIA